MKKIFVSTIALFVIVFLVGCSDTTSPNEGTVNVVSEMLNPSVSIVPVKSKLNNEIQANEVDSIKITSIRILLSEMKLHSTTTDSTDGKALKTTPFLFHIDTLGNLIQLTSTSIPVGSYEKIKLEFHRFSSSETSQYATDPVLKDFATSDRYTVIINGTYFKNNLPTDFTYNSKITANLTFNFVPSINIEEGATTTISIQVDPTLFFKLNGSILDPTNSKNFSVIENAIKNSIKAQKRA